MTNIHLLTEKGCIATNHLYFMRGIFQRDSLSTLLFCIALITITNLPKRNNLGYKIADTKVSNLLYIHDLKVNAKNEEEMERCCALIAMFSRDIKMEFGLQKCAVIHIQKGIIQDSPCVHNMPLVSSNDSYKYLGILQSSIIHHDMMKEKAKKEYFNMIRGILKADIKAAYTTDAIRTYAMPILCYGFGVPKWTRNEIRAIDTKTQKVLTKNGFHHPKSILHRLYLARKWGGRGLIGAMDCYIQECAALAKYLNKNNCAPLVKIVTSVEKHRVYGIMSYIDTPKNTDKIITMAYCK